jgi:hypothetical protein
MSLFETEEYEVCPKCGGSGLVYDEKVDATRACVCSEQNAPPRPVVATPPPAPESILTIEEMRDAWKRGLERHRVNRGRGTKGRYGNNLPDETQRRFDAESAVSEALVSKVTGRAWIGGETVKDDPNLGDVAGGVAVRWTERRNGSLILHPEDKDHLNAVLVVGNSPDQRIVGWINVADGKRLGTWRTDVRFPAFFVSQSHLDDIATLP